MLPQLNWNNVERHKMDHWRIGGNFSGGGGGGAVSSCLNNITFQLCQTRSAAGREQLTYIYIYIFFFFFLGGGGESLPKN